MTDPVPCRLYLISPAQIEISKFAVDVAAALKSGDVACLLLRLPDAEDEALRDAIRTIMPICHDHDVALVISERADIAAQMNADGVHVAKDQYPQARALVGADRIVGVTSARSRHAAMEAAETGADFVGFTGAADFVTFAADGDQQTAESGEIFALNEILEWWQGLIEIPCVALGQDLAGLSLTDCTNLAQSGADFVAVGDIVWQYSDGPAAGVAAAISAISVA